MSLGVPEDWTPPSPRGPRWTAPVGPVQSPGPFLTEGLCLGIGICMRLFILCKCSSFCSSHSLGSLEKSGRYVGAVRGGACPAVATGQRSAALQREVQASPWLGTTPQFSVEAQCPPEPADTLSQCQRVSCWRGVLISGSSAPWAWAQPRLRMRSLGVCVSGQKQGDRGEFRVF